MAGQYFYDPRPFYLQPGDYKLISLDDCFVQQKGQGGGGKGGGGGGGEGKGKGGGEGGGEGKGKGGGEGGGGSKDKDKEKEGDGNKKKEPEKPKVQTIEVRVHLCCDNCVSKVRRKLEVEGVDKVDCCQWTKRVIVKGTVKPEVVLKRVRKVKKDAELVTPAKK